MSDNDDKAARSQRRYKRVSTREVTAVVRSEAGIVMYTVANLSIGGALVTGAAPPERGTPLAIGLSLKGSKAVAVTGQVVHVRAEGIGIAFDEVGPADTLALEKLIAAAESQNVLPPPLPLLRTRTNDELPAMAPRPDDAFFEGKDPRPPHAGSPDEKLEYLRALLKNRDDSIKRGRAAIATIVAEADALRGLATRLKAKLDAAAGQHALTEVSLASARAANDKQIESHQSERDLANEMLELEQRRTRDVLAQVAELEARLHRQEDEARHALAAAEAARNQAALMANEAAGAKRARDELHAANRRAMEASAALTKERQARVVAEVALAEERSADKVSAAEAKQLKDDAAHLKDEVARVKAKLVNAENALEKMASRKPARRSP